MGWLRVTADSMIATILRQAPADRRASIAAWRQLTDILAQRGNQLDTTDIRRAFHALAVLRRDVPEKVRRDCAVAVARHGRFAPLVAFYANDVPAVSATMLRRARLAEADWLAMLPTTAATARSILAGRSDLPVSVRRALVSLGAGSVALPQPALAAADVAASDVAESALGGEPGADGAAVGAFRQRAEIVNARMILEGSAADAGEWRFSALPWFDPATGQFRGYRGTARRPQRNELPYGRPESSDSGDSIRQLIHELRSPLNAISGFAQIISGQMFGPVSGAYRKMADSIIADAGAVQDIIDDLEVAARSTGVVETKASDEVADLATVMAQIEGDLAPLLADQRIDLSISRVGGPFLAHADDANSRRMVGRLLTALVDICEAGTTLVGQLVAEAGPDDMLQLRIVRPAAIRFASAADLLDPGFSPEGEAPGAAILSLGFSLRLVDSLARGAGGRLDIGHNALTLYLPSANPRADTELGAQHGE